MSDFHKKFYSLDFSKNELTIHKEEFDKPSDTIDFKEIHGVFLENEFEDTSGTQYHSGTPERSQSAFSRIIRGDSLVGSPKHKLDCKWFFEF